MRTLRVPAGITHVSFGDQQYIPDGNGLVQVSDEAAQVFARPPHGFTYADEPSMVFGEPEPELETVPVPADEPTTEAEEAAPEEEK